MKIINKFFSFGIVALLIGLALGPARVVAQAYTMNAQPELAQLATQWPGQTVSVIVQKLSGGSAVEDSVARLGGQVTQDLPIINAFAATMPAEAALTLAGAAGVRWVSLDADVTQSTVAPGFVTWATTISSSVSNTFINPQAATDSALGPNATYASGAIARGAFDGFTAEVTPGQAIGKVEVALWLYTSARPVTGQDPQISVTVAGNSSPAVVLNHSVFSNCVGKAYACLVYADLTSARKWLWSDFDNTLDLGVTIDQSSFKSGWTIYYDAVGLRVSDSTGTDFSDTLLDTAKIVFNKANSMRTGGTDTGIDPSLPPITTSNLANVFNQVVRATDTWNTGPGYLRGDGTTIAVVDSGIVRHSDVSSRLVKSVNFNKAYHDSADRYGHGTFVSSIIAGDGTNNSRYLGIAPKANLINVRVSDDNGGSSESDVISGLQWILDHHVLYNIQVVNLSLNSSVAQTYLTAPLDAAVEILWFNGIVVVASAGNNGTATLFPPANDPFVITVGATDDRGTTTLADDGVASFSASGITSDGFAKPDLVAPGKNIVAYMPDNGKLTLGKNHPGNKVDSQHFRMSGTSMAAPVVSGAVALLLQNDHTLTPDQVKYRLMATANKNWPGYTAAGAGAGYLDIYAAVFNPTTQSANTGVAASQLLWSGLQPITWGSVAWNSVAWNSVAWNSVAWNSVAWNSVAWNSDYWGN